jgi:hypothetical protein
MALVFCSNDYLKQTSLRAFFGVEVNRHRFTDIRWLFSDVRRRTVVSVILERLTLLASDGWQLAFASSTIIAPRLK